jgi:hypothetical protein
MEKRFASPTSRRSSGARSEMTRVGEKGAPSHSVSRRSLLLWAPSLALAAVSCSKPKQMSCDDLSALSANELELRERVLYRTRAPKPDLECDRCVQYVAGPTAECGTCRVMPGPTLAAGYCRLFAQRA